MHMDNFFTAQADVQSKTLNSSFQMSLTSLPHASYYKKSLWFLKQAIFFTLHKLWCNPSHKSSVFWPMSHLICCTAQSASGSLKANKPPPTIYETPMVPPSAQHLSILRSSMSMDGNPRHVKFTLLFPGFQQNTLKTCRISVSPYIWRTQEEIFISLLLTFFFLSPFIELCNMHSMHKTSPDAPGNHNRYPPAQKALMWGKAQVPRKEMTSFPSNAHTQSGQQFQRKETKACSSHK